MHSSRNKRRLGSGDKNQSQNLVAKLLLKSEALYTGAYPVITVCVPFLRRTLHVEHVTSYCIRKSCARLILLDYKDYAQRRHVVVEHWKKKKFIFHAFRAI
jgi:hypothetical protein